MNVETICQRIQSAIPDAQVDVQSPDGVHFEATVVSASFLGQSKLSQHRRVYAALGAQLGASIHALQLTTRAPRLDEHRAP